MKRFLLAKTPLDRGTTLLEASAGTGKTYTIAGIVLRLLLEDVVDGVGQVLVVTFTVAATEELKTRLRRALAEALLACEGQPVEDPFLRGLGERHGAAGARKLRAALASIDELSVATIHGFCLRVLTEAAFESGMPFRTEFVEDEVPLLAGAARDAVRLAIDAGDGYSAAVLRQAGLLPDELARQYRQWRLRAGTRLLPEPPPLDEALADLRAAAARARAPFAPALADLFRRLPFKANERSPVLDAGPGFGRELQQRLQDPDDVCVEWLCQLAPSRLEEQLKRGRPPLDHPFFAACERVGEAMAAAELSLRQALFRAMHVRLLGAKARGRSLTFQDLLEQVHGALHDPTRGKRLLAAVRARWQAALIDEFQDTDPLQYEIFAACFADRRLFLVGDCKQSIYGFRGADVHVWMRARRDARAQWTLAENHRSHPRLVDAVAELFGGPAAFALPGIDLPEVEAARTADDCEIRPERRAPLVVRWLPPGDGDRGPTPHQREYAEQRVVGDVADECVRLLATELLLPRGKAVRRLCAGDIAVLTRTNSQAVAVQDELRRRGVNSAIGKAGDVFRCPEMDEMLRLLPALASPTRLPLLRAAWSTMLWGMSASRLQELDRSPALLGAELARADQLRRTWVRHGFVVMFQDVLRNVDARERLLRRPDGERRLTNWLQIAELLHQAEHGRNLAPESLVQWLVHERRHAQEIDYQLRELRLESDADAVQILTVHGSKGLEYEVVFVPFAWQWREPARGGGPVLVRGEAGQPVFHCRPGDDERAALGAETLQEDLRLLYVALTRARRRCYLHVAPAKSAPSSALAFLLLGPGRDVGVDPAPLSRTPDWADQVRKRLPRWRSDLGRIADASDGAIEIVDLPAQAPPEPRPVLPGTAAEPLPRPRALPEHGPARFRIASFTSLLAHDRRAEPLRELDEPDAPAAAAGAAPAGMAAFARGARAGICLHEILEHVDFAAAGDALRDLVQRTLWRHGLQDPGAHAAAIDAPAVVTALLRALGAARLGDLPFRLADVPAGARIPEWQFFLAAGRLRPSDLRGVFAAHAGPALRGYAERLGALPDRALHGFLRGFVDLVVEHGGRYFVFDWKSNHLGDDAAAYAPDRLLADMQENDYVLQYHLYLLALHRHLRARLADYDYERHVGGACYVYLRGVEAGAGVFCDRPGRALIEALDGWLRGEAAR